MVIVCRACPSPAGRSGYCKPCLALAVHWGATKANPQTALTTAMLRAYHANPPRPDGSPSAAFAAPVWLATVVAHRIPPSPRKPSALRAYKNIYLPPRQNETQAEWLHRQKVTKPPMRILDIPIGCTGGTT